MKIALVGNDDFSMYHFRAGLIRALLAAHEVVCVVPPGPYIEKLRELGAVCIPLPMRRFSSPLRDLALIWQLYRVFHRERFDIVHTMTVKPNVFGSIAAWAAGVPRIVGLVSGLGFLTMAETRAERIRNAIATTLYRIAFRIFDRVWFQNPDDLAYFVQRGLLPEEKGVVILSGGINLDEFSMAAVDPSSIEALRVELSIPPGEQVVMMVAARCIWSKGVREFLETARLALESCPGWTFVMLAPFEETPDAVPREFLESSTPRNTRVITTFRHDVKRFVALADLMVLPSFYREGVPRILLEAMAMGKPVVTTDNPGCREVVEQGRNGFLVPVRDCRSLHDVVRRLCNDTALREQMGHASRSKAAEEFSEELVVGRIVADLYRLPKEATPVTRYGMAARAGGDQSVSRDPFA